MTEENRAAAELALNYTFTDPALLKLALTHASMTESRLDSNERLEFLGDSILGLIVSERIFMKYPDQLEGEMTKIKSTTVSRNTCAKIARELGLEDMLRLGKGMKNHVELPQSLAAAVLEAIIAVIYIDGGFGAAQAFLIPLIDPFIERAEQSGHQHNFKSVLQQHAQQSYNETPVYRILDEKGPDHAKCFKVAVQINGRTFESSWGQSKKQAEQQAALNALHELGLAEDDGDGEVRVVTNGC